MITYLSGAVHQSVLTAGRPDLGVMLTPMMGNAPDLSGIVWAADTGCFAAPEKFCIERYLTWLNARSHWADTCLFATAPDRFGDGAMTWELSQPALPRIREAGYPADLVAQPGIEQITIDWDAFDVLFVGGPDPWRYSIPLLDLLREARERGKPTHLGRVNSFRRLRSAYAVGYDSADGTYCAFGPDINIPRVLRWLSAVNAQTPMRLEVS